MEGARQRNDLGSEVTLTVEDIFFLMRRSKVCRRCVSVCVCVCAWIEGRGRVSVK